MMTDLTQLSDDELIDSFEAHFAEGHRRLNPTSHTRAKVWFAASHGSAERALKALSDNGTVAARSGDDKDRGDEGP